MHQEEEKGEVEEEARAGGREEFLIMQPRRNLSLILKRSTKSLRPTRADCSELCFQITTGFLPD